VVGSGAASAAGAPLRRGAHERGGECALVPPAVVLSKDAGAHERSGDDVFVQPARTKPARPGRRCCVEVVRREDGHRTHAAWQWCVGARHASVASGGALVVVLVVGLAGAKAAARTRRARPVRKCWSEVFEEKTGTECTLLGSGVWCSSCECGL
jgi:hypothetical protein